MRNTRQSSKSIIAAVVTTPCHRGNQSTTGTCGRSCSKARRIHAKARHFGVHAVCNARVLYKKNSRPKRSQHTCRNRTETSAQRLFARHAQHVRCIRVTTAVRAHIFVRKRFGQQMAKLILPSRYPPQAPKAAAAKLKNRNFPCRSSPSPSVCLIAALAHDHAHRRVLLKISRMRFSR